MRLKLLLTAVTLTLCTTCMSAKDATVKSAEGVMVKYALNNSEQIARVKGYDETMKRKVTIPNRIKVDGVNYTVTKIGDGAFKNSDFETIVLPNTITLIGKEAFAESWLKNFSMPPKVEAIKESAFHSTLITSVTIPATCTEIGTMAFHETKLKNLVFEEGFRDLIIGGYAFCGNYLNSLTIPFRVSSIGEGAFNNSDITSLVWLSKVTSIPDYCFMRCRKLQNVDLSLNIRSIGKYSFAECDALTSVTIPGSITTIADYAFWRSAISVLKIPEGVTALGQSAFSTCTALRSVWLPSTLKTIGGTCFRSCEAISEVICDAQIPPVCGNSVFDNETLNTATLTVPDDAKELYKNADTWWRFLFGRDDTGLDSVTGASTTEPEYYTLDGTRIETPVSGQICIELLGGRKRKVVWGHTR